MARTAHATLTQGTIKTLHTLKGFGFIQAADGQEYFFHKSAVRGAEFDELLAGDAVRFEPGMGDKGPRANAVHPVA